MPGLNHGALLQVDREELDMAFGHLGGERPDRGEFLAGQVEVHRPGFRLNPEDADSKRISRLRSVHEDRTGH